MKKLFIFLAICALILAFLPTPIHAAPEPWVLDGNRVYVDNKDYYISASPAILGSSGWVDIEFRSKKYDSVDLVFQFPWENGVTYSIIQFQREMTRTAYTYEPSTVSVYNNMTKEYEDIPTTIPVPYTETYMGWDNLVKTDVVAGVSSGSWSTSKLKDKLVKGQLYKARIWVDLPLTYRNPIQGKYIIGLLPWGKTIDEANSSGMLYLLDPWYNSNWDYRKPFEMTGTAAGAQTDYQLKLTVHYGAGADSGSDVYLNSHCNADFSDIRFTKGDGSTLLSYWIESYTASTTATVWVEFDNIPANPNTANFYIYYGNAVATTTSSGTGTWIIFGDGTTLTGWTEVDDAGGGVTYSVTGGYFKGIGDGGTDSGYLYSDTTAPNDFRLRVDIQAETSSTLNQQHGIVHHSSAGTSPYYSGWYDISTLDKWGIYTAGGETLSSQDTGFDCSQWHQYELTTEGSNWKLYMDNSLKVSKTEDANYSYVGLRYRNSDSAKYVYYDDFCLGKFCSPEPTFTSWAEEETPDVPTVISSAAGNITSEGGDLHGEITNNGGTAVTTVGFEWDVDTGAPYANDWHAAYSTDVFEHTFNDMPPGTTIYWRAYATNSVGTGYSAERNFDTLLPLPLVPTNFTVTQSDVDSVGCAWVMGTYATTTYVRVKEGSYPTDPTDGFGVWSAAGIAASYDGLNLSMLNYYWRAWSHNATGFSLETADATIGGEGMNNLTLFLVLPGIMGMGLLFVSVIPRRKNLLLTLAAAFFWLAMGFWWVIGDVFTGMGMEGAYTDILAYIPFLFFFVILLEYMTKANQTEIQRTLGGKTWSEFGTPPRSYESGYERYRRQLYGKTRR